MPHFVALTLSVWLAAVPLAAGEPTPDEMALAKDLAELDAMRKGLDTDADQVERRGEELLRQYVRPGEQARIHYQLADVHAQSGLVHPELVIEHAQKALQLPLDPGLRVRLYLHWGNAVKVSDRTKPAVANRKEAATIYLEGLKELEGHDLPETPPERPRWNMQTVLSDNGPSPEEVRRRNEERMAARRKAEFERTMCRYRDTLQHKLFDLYRRRPYAGTEIRELATQIVGNPATVNAILKRLEEVDAMRDDPPADGPSRESPKPRGVAGWIIFGNAALVLAIVVWLLRRRHHGSEGAAPGSNGNPGADMEPE